MSSLFRKEALARRSDRLHGEVLLNQSHSAIALAALLLVILACAATWVLLGTYARTETARGILVSSRGSVKVLASRTGILSSLMVGEGDIVAEGQRLAFVEVEQPVATGDRFTAQSIASIDQQEKLARSRIALAEQKARTDAERLEVTRGALVQQRAGLLRQLSLQQEFVRSTRASFESIGELVQRGVISKAEFERRRQAVLAAQQEEERLAQQIGSAESDLARVQSDVERVRIDASRDIGEIRSSIESQQQQKARLLSESGYAVNAPTAGRVTAIQTSVGRTVGGAVPLLAIVPVETPLSAEIYAPSRAIGFVRAGQEVRLLYDAFPYQRFGSFEATIRSVSRVVLAAAELDAPLRIEEPVYRVTAEIRDQQLVAFGDIVTLQPGMMLTANIVLDRRSFLDWLMTPFNAVGKRGS